VAFRRQSLEVSSAKSIWASFFGRTESQLANQRQDTDSPTGIATQFDNADPEYSGVLMHANEETNLLR
jgi:hypothetical protein